MTIHAGRWGKPARLAVVALVLAAILFVFVFPTRAYLAERGQVRAAAHDVAVITAENDRLAEEAARLQTPAEIEKMAREQFHYVFPGEQQFIVIPGPDGPSTTTTVPTTSSP